MANPKSLYYLDCKAGTSVYNSKNDLIGVTTGYATRPNGTKGSIGAIEIESISGLFWIEGYGGFVFGMGIKWLY